MTVTEAVANVYVITFGGSFTGFQQPQLTAAATGTTTASPAITTNGVGGTIVTAGRGPGELGSDLALENVQLNGDGIAPGLNGHNTGALRSITGFNTVTGNLALNSSTTIGVDSGSQLTIGPSATLLGPGGSRHGCRTITGPFGLTKELTGTLDPRLREQLVHRQHHR